MAVKQLPKISDLPEPPDRLVGDQERFDVLTFNSLKAQKKMVNEDLNKTLIPALNQFAVDVNASVDAAKASEASALASKNSAASSATTATTKAGEAAASATAAKASETSALASKNAAGISATAAANAQNAAEAALANVGYVSEGHAGLAKVDGKTTQADAGGTITVKDVAIGGNLGDLASKRGQIGDNIRINTASDLNAYTKAGNWLFSDAAAGENFPNIGRGGELNCYVSTTAIFQFFTEFNNNRRYIRYGIPNSTWTNWIQFISVAQLGDGIRNTNGIISVPEYEGATASSAGTSGLVPPAAAGQHESFLTGGGEYKPALTTISDSVELSDSTTAASAKAVKKVYDDVPSMAAHAAMPRVDRFIYIVFTGGRYTAPEDGYIAVNKAAGSGQFERMRLEVVDGNDNMIYGTTSPGAYDSQQVLCWLPVSKGAKVKVMDDLSGPWVYAHFIYANGAA
jgi:hypothetical protein